MAAFGEGSCLLSPSTLISEPTDSKNDADRYELSISLAGKDRKTVAFLKNKSWKQLSSPTGFGDEEGGFSDLSLVQHSHKSM